MYKFVNKDNNDETHYVSNITRLSLFVGSKTWDDKCIYIHIHCDSDEPIIIKKPYDNDELAKSIMTNIQTQFEESLLNCNALTIIEY